MKFEMLHLAESCDVIELHAKTLLSPPHSIGFLLTLPGMLSSSVDLKLKHSTMGLLKHLAQSSLQSTANHILLNDARIIQGVVDSGVLEEQNGVTFEIIQLNALGILKYMCGGSG